MSYKIVGDSCLDLTEEMRKDSRFQIVPDIAGGRYYDRG